MAVNGGDATVEGLPGAEPRHDGVPQAVPGVKPLCISVRCRVQAVKATEGGVATPKSRPSLRTCDDARRRVRVQRIPVVPCRPCALTSILTLV